MILHKDKESFNMAINSTALYYNVAIEIIEKDYYVTLFLKELAKKVPDLIFKGGTCLSKCFKLIDRFSEDIDITLHPDKQSQSKKKYLKQIIKDICNELQLCLLNEEETRSRRDYNCYKIDYFSKYTNLSVKQNLLVETTFLSDVFETEIQQGSSLIYDYFKSQNNEVAIKEYQLEPFDICVQSLERTFVDKVFAICDYKMLNITDRHSRHIYDLAQLLPQINLDDNLKKLIYNVREERKTKKKCPSALDNTNINEILRDIIDSKYFENDYRKNLENLLFKRFAYENCIIVLETIINSNIFV